MESYSWKEMIAVLLARVIEDGESVIAGAHTEIFFGGTLLAQKTHAPNLRLQLGATCLLVNVTDREIESLPKTSTDFQILGWAESHHDHPLTFLQYRAPGGDRYGEPDSPYRDKSVYRHFFGGDKFFVGAIEVDRWGNVNLIGIPSNGKLAMRGPGTIGICDAATGVRDLFVFVTKHDTRRLVDQVSLVSMPGNRGLREHGYHGRVKWIVTPKAIFDFDPDTDQARLFATFPGTDVDWVRDNTGFEFDAPDPLTVPAPTKEELQMLRQHVDRTGLLRA